ncbi:uncharacterized protein LOC117125462 [Anneissia japonica]|uniref:uncharacterized protein LOC117125462 n=1 Tax=Anneissia japonica TaxID=1529436 RepID=UPI0014254E32|nr:uncharacterized protein LOC117125462 [Anneissia japonica]
MININNNLTLEPTDKNMYVYGQQDKVNVLGTTKAMANFGDKFELLTFVVVDTKDSSIFGYPSASKLGFIHVNSNHPDVSFSEKFGKTKCEMHNVKGVNTTNDMLEIPNCPVSVKEIISKHENVFNGMGKYTDKKIKLHIDQNVKPVNQNHRRIPYHLRQKVETE